MAFRHPRKVEKLFGIRYMAVSQVGQAGLGDQVDRGVPFPDQRLESVELRGCFT